MSASSTPDLAEDYAGVLRGVGLTRSELDDPHVDEGPLSAETVRWDLELTDPDEAYVQLQQTLSRSDRGIEAPRRYWSHAPAFQLSDVLESYGYGVSFEAPGGGPFEAADETFDVVLEGDDQTYRMSFTYPRGEYGTDNYPALVHAVERRLLPRDDLTFVLLDGREDAWRFVLVEVDDLTNLREDRGHRVEVFGRPLLDADQPSDFVGEDAVTDPSELNDEESDGLVGGFDSVVSASGIDDVFETIEREAATQPVGNPGVAGVDVDEEISEIITSVEATSGGGSTVVRDVSGDQLDEVIDRFEADPTSVDDASAHLGAIDAEDAATEAEDSSTPELKAEHIPSPSPRRSETGGGLSEQVAETLYSGGVDPAAGSGTADDDGTRAARRPDEAGFVPAVDPGMETDPGESMPADESTVTDEPDGDSTEPPSAVDVSPAPDDVEPAFRSDDEGDDEPAVMKPVEDEAGDHEEDQGTLGRLSDTVRSLF